MKLVMSNGGWESLTSDQREALNMVMLTVMVMVMVMVILTVMVTVMVAVTVTVTVMLMLSSFKPWVPRSCSTNPKGSILIISPTLYYQAGVDPVLCNVPTIERVGGGGIRLVFVSSEGSSTPNLTYLLSILLGACWLQFSTMNKVPELVLWNIDDDACFKIVVSISKQLRWVQFVHVSQKMRTDVVTDHEGVTPKSFVFRCAYNTQLTRWA